MAEGLRLPSWEREGLLAHYPDLDESDLESAEKWLALNPRKKPDRLIEYYQNWLERARKNKQPARQECDPKDYTYTVEQGREICQNLLKQLSQVERLEVAKYEKPLQFECQHENMLRQHGAICPDCDITTHQIFDDLAHREKVKNDNETGESNTV